MAFDRAGPVLPPQAGKRRLGKATVVGWLIWPALLLFALFFLLPLGVLGVMAFLSGNPVNAPAVHFTLRHFARFFGDDLYPEALWATLRIGFLTTLAALLLGYPLAHLMARAHSRMGHALLLMAVIAPMLTGIVVRTFAWMTLLQDRGVINTTLVALGVTERPVKLMYNEFGTIVALTHIYVPFMVLTLAGVIGRVDERLEDAARSLGATRWQAFREVTLPLSLPGILAGSLLVFALSISAYVTPFLMGGTDVLTLPMLIYQQVSSSFNPNFAGALGLILLAVSLAVVIAYNKVLAGWTGEELS